MTAIVALVVLVSIPFWQTAIEQSRAWRLSRRLHDPVESVRRAAVEGLVQLGPSSSSWVIRAMRDPDARVRLAACSIVVRTAPDLAELPLGALLGAVADGDAAVRLAAVGQLEALIARYGSPSESSARERAVGALCAALRDASPQVRTAAGWALFNLGPKARSAVAELDRASKGRTSRYGSSPRKQCFGSTRRRRARALPPPCVSCSPINRSGSATGAAVRVLVLAQGEDATAALLLPLLKDKDIATRFQAINDLIEHCAASQIAQIHTDRGLDE